MARKWAIPVALLALVGAVIGLLVSKTTRPIYTAGGTILVLSASAKTAASQDLTQLTSTYAALMTQRPLLDTVSKDLNSARSGGELQGEVFAAPIKDTQLIGVYVADRDPQVAAQIANTLMSDFVNQVAKDNEARIKLQGAGLTPEIDQLSTQLADLQGQLATAQRAKQDTTDLNREIANVTQILATLRASQATIEGSQRQNLDSVEVAAAASAPGAPTSPNTTNNALLGGFAGLLVGIALAVLLQFLDQGLHSAEDVRRKLGLPTLAVVPRHDVPAGGIPPGHDPDADQAAEAYRRLRTNLLFTGIDRPVRSVVVTSAQVGEGKTRIAANLAGAVAASGNRVLLVDADMRRPCQHRVFHKPLAQGISDMLLLGDRAPTMALNGQRETDFPNLSLVTAGTIPPNPSELLASAQATALFEFLTRQYDFVVIDTPPIGAATDALILAGNADATLLVTEVGRTNARQAEHAIGALRSVNARVLGLVLNKARKRDLDYYYYYYVAPSAHPDRTAAAGDAGAPSSNAPTTSSGGWRPVGVPMSGKR